MDTTVPSTALAAPGAAPSGFAALTASRKLSLAAGVAALLALAVAAAMWARQPEWRVLYAGLGDKDGGAVITALNQMNVPYRFAEGGAIMVPGERVHDARLKLASQGVPRGGTVGFELMENQKFGVTQFQERLNFQRGLEGELARSIQSLAAVQSARVHLALPAQNGFLREQQKPSASVLVTLHPAHSLDRSQIAGIVHLVASSVPELSTRQVSVVDQNGALLSSQGEGAPGGLDATQLGYRRQVESAYAQRVLDILEPIVGRGNARAQVTADLDFTQSEQTAEQYRPNQGSEPAAVRSTQVLEANSRDGAATAQGVPGALTNQPPPPATAPVNGPAQTPAAAGQAGAAANAATGRREAVTNYEVDKTVRVVRNAVGTVKRLSAAVVVNHRKTVDAAGKVTYVALTPQELESINALVREAVGFSKDRGDSINVVNSPFVLEPAEPVVETPLWKDPEMLGLAAGFGKYAALVLLALAIIFMVIRPALKAAQAAAPPPPAPRLERTVDNDVALPAPEGQAEAAAATQADAEEQRILELARGNPATVANVVKTWVAKE